MKVKTLEAILLYAGSFLIGLGAMLTWGWKSFPFTMGLISILLAIYIAIIHQR